MESNAEIASAKRLRLGLLLAWIPLMLFVVPTAIGIINALAQIATRKQTGLGAVAGGFTEMLVTFGLVVIVGSQVTAIVMLLRTLSRSHPIRTIVAIISAVAACSLWDWGCSYGERRYIRDVNSRHSSLSWRVFIIRLSAGPFANMPSAALKREQIMKTGNKIAMCKF